MEEAVSVIAGLVNAVECAKAEVAAEGCGRRAAFFEDVGEGPEGEHFDVADALADRIGKCGTNVDGVTGFELAWDIPLSPEERELGLSGVIDVGSNLGDCAAYTVVHGDQLVGVEEVLDGVVGVAVGRYEVD